MPTLKLRLWVTLAFSTLVSVGQLQAQAAPAAPAERTASAPTPSLSTEQRKQRLDAAVKRLPSLVAEAGENSEAAGELMFQIGSDYSHFDQNTQARDMYQRALKNEISRKGEDHQHVAISRYWLGDVLEDLGDLEGARELMAKALAVLGGKAGFSNITTLRVTQAYGRVLLSLGRHEDSVKVLRIDLKRRVVLQGEESEGVTTTKGLLANALNGSGQFVEGLALQRELIALAIKQSGANSEAANTAQMRHAGALMDAGSHESALDLARAVAANRERSLGAEHDKTLLSKSQLSGMYSNQGDFAQALSLARAVSAARAKLSGEDDPQTLLAKLAEADALDRLGSLPEALALQQLTIKRMRSKLGDKNPMTMEARLSYSVTLGRTGLYGDAGKIQQELHNESRAQSGATSLLSLRILQEFANTLRALEQWDLAVKSNVVIVEARTKSLGIEHRETLAVVHNLAIIHIQQKQTAEAISALERSTAAIEAGKGKHAAQPDLHYYYRTLGEAYVAGNQRPQARAAFARSLELVRAQLGTEHALVANILSFAAEAEDDIPTRISMHSNALRIAQAADQPEFVWRAANGLRLAHAKAGNSTLAVMYGKKAINTIQQLRAGLKGFNQGIQSTFLVTKREIYTGTADLLIADGRLAEGQQVLALLKQDEYNEFVTRSEKADATQSKLSLNGQETAWLERFNQIGDKLVASSKRKAALDAKLRAEPLSAAESAERTQLEAYLQSARLAFDAATKQMVADARRDAQAANTDQRASRELVESVRAMRSDLRQLGHGAVLLHYLMTQDKVWILLTTPEIQLARESVISAADMNRKIAAFRNVLRQPSSDPKPLAQELYRLLLAPVAKDLQQAQAKTLMLSLDGALRYVPFGALHDGSKYAIEDFRIAIFTEAAKSKIKDVPQAQWSIAGLGLTLAVPGFEPLPAVRDELTGIVKSASNANGVMAGEAHFDAAFTVARVKALLDNSPPVLHIASHFKFTPGTEADSFLVMGDGARLSLQQIRQDDLQFNVDLLTLSACETAVGDNARGQEVEGLGALAQKQGAKAVLATLWPVADSSTGLFMREMYRIRAEQKLTKAEAIRQVQLGFANGRLKAGDALALRSASVAGAVRTADTQVKPGQATNYGHPFYWAPFILMGNWL